METFQFGSTSSDLPILGHRLGRSGPEVLVLGGVHGNEPEGVVASFGLLQRFLPSYTLKVRLTIVPQFNLDGVLKLERRNARGVDLNRNLPTKDWTANVKEEKYFPGHEPNSESENRALVAWIDTVKPMFIMSLHSWKPCLNINGNCRPEAEVIKAATGYEIIEDIGYPTPGCLGTYCGLERDIPTLTYEIERGLDAPRVLKTHVPALHEALKSIEKRF